jgi:hypothetical protein
MAHNTVTLKNIIGDFKIALDSDDYISNVSDVQLRNIALRGIRDIGFDLGKKVKSLKLPVETNDTVNLPDDFVDLIKIGVVAGDGLVYVFAENKNINHSYQKISDTGVDATYTTFNNAPLNIEANKIENIVEAKTATLNQSDTIDSFYEYVFENFMYEGGIGRIYGMGGGHHRGEYRINLDQNRIEVKKGSDINEVVLEYVADEARSGNPAVHVYAEEALRAYMYYKLIEKKATVPAGEKARARAEYYNERRLANARLSNFTKENALKTIRKNFTQAPKY